jgi:hypothetical protein
VVQLFTHRTIFQVVGMADWLDLAMLVCASAGALGFGIFAAYAILKIGFAFMRPRQLPVPVKAEPETARIS